ncbi:MAG: amidase [Candidatus Nanopelagicales bacterium]
MSELHDLTALEQAAAIRTREISAVELAEHYLARTEALNDTVGAFITVTPEIALEQARSADATVGDCANPDDLPVLHGVVIPVKDLNFQAGVRCTLGSATFDIVPYGDDNVVLRMKQGNLVMTGKTNTPEFGLPCYTENAVAPAARTPWDLTRSAGGSSGGAAAAVASGLAAAAHGSDGGGSIRIPASVCGLVGIKPSRGRISNGPLRDPVGEFPVSGPIARTVRDAAALLDVMAGAFPDDPYPAPPLLAGETFLRAAGREPGVLRIGRFAQPIAAGVVIHEDCLEAYEQASALLEEFGHVVEDIDPPLPEMVVPAFEIIWSVLAQLTPVEPDKEELLQPLTRHLRERGSRQSGLDLAGAVSFARVLARGAINATSPYDVILTPGLALPPVPVGHFTEGGDSAVNFERQKAFTPFTAVFNLTGQPAMSLPLHWNAEGLPIGVQIVGRPYDEMTLISLAAQLEQARPWLGRHPDLW